MKQIRSVRQNSHPHTHRYLLILINTFFSTTKAHRDGWWWVDACSPLCSVIIAPNVNAALESRQQHIFLHLKLSMSRREFLQCENDEATHSESGKVQSEALLSEMMINDCHEFTIIDSWQQRPQYEHTHIWWEEFNKKSFFIFLSSDFLDENFPSSSYHVLRQWARDRRFEQSAPLSTLGEENSGVEGSDLLECVARGHVGGIALFSALISDFPGGKFARAKTSDSSEISPHRMMRWAHIRRWWLRMFVMLPYFSTTFIFPAKGDSVR